MFPTSRAPFCAVLFVLFGASCAPRDSAPRNPDPRNPVGEPAQVPPPSANMPAGGEQGSGAESPDAKPPGSSGDASAELPPDIDHGPEPQSALPPDVTIGEPKYTSGEVPDVVSALNKHRDDIAQCIAKHGGLAASSGELEIQFLVRAQGKAEGVGVNKRKAVGVEAGKCIQDLLKNKRVGAPSEDPVGVTVKIALKETSGS